MNDILSYVRTFLLLAPRSPPQNSSHVSQIGKMLVIYARDNQLHGRGVNLAVISVVFTFVAVCLVASRLASRLTTGRKLHEDDYAIIVSVVSLAPQSKL